MKKKEKLISPELFKGVWIVRKKKKKDNEYYLELIRELINKGYDTGGVINFGKSNENFVFNMEDDDYIFLNDFDKGDNFKRKKIVFEKFKFKKNISIKFSFFSSFFDKRWEDIPYPPSLLYLAGKTSKEGIKSSISIIEKEFNIKKTPETDFWGWTIFDDLLDDTINFIKEIRLKYKGLTGGGGPFITLAPIYAIVHLPELNFILRGEADNSITEIIKLMAAIKKNNIFSVFNHIREFKGFYYNDENLFILSNIDKINRVENIDDIEIDFSIVRDDILKRGLELNLSRGCPRACIFCSHVHGRNFRVISPEKLDKILSSFKNETAKRKIYDKKTFYININDDDILLAGEKTAGLIDIIKKNGFKIYGFQTSISSFTDKHKINYKILDSIADNSLYVNKPLLWIGTDTFLETRGKRLGKTYLKRDLFEKLIQEFENRGIINYHYWIILDGDSDWNEFIEEFFYLWDISDRFENFNILPTSSYLIPYPYSSAFIKDLKREKTKLIIKKTLKSRTGFYDYPLVEREEPEDEFLTRSVSPVFEYKTIEYIKNKRFFKAFQRIYSYLKKSNYYLKMNDEKRFEFIDKLNKRVEIYQKLR